MKNDMSASEYSSEPMIGFNAANANSEKEYRLNITQDIS
jgi:hypothetical protein